MKKLLIGLLTLGSISSFAQNDCGVKINGVNSNLENISQVLHDKGYHVTDSSDSDFILTMNRKKDEITNNRYFRLLRSVTVSANLISQNSDIDVDILIKKKIKTKKMDKKVRNLQGKMYSINTSGKKIRNDRLKKVQLEKKIITDQEKASIELVHQLPLCDDLI